MTTTIERPVSGATEQVEFATFYIGDMLMGLDIQHVDEINRNVDVTPVPHAPAQVRGVVNLRGEVATVVSLRQLLELESIGLTRDSRNVIVAYHGEQIGLLVDRVADVVKVRREAIEPPPANIGGVDGRYIKGVCNLENGLLIVLDREAVLDV